MASPNSVSGQGSPPNNTYSAIHKDVGCFDKVEPKPLDMFKQEDSGSCFVRIHPTLSRIPFISGIVNFFSDCHRQMKYEVTAKGDPCTMGVSKNIPPIPLVIMGSAIADVVNASLSRPNDPFVLIPLAKKLDAQFDRTQFISIAMDAALNFSSTPAFNPPRGFKQKLYLYAVNLESKKVFEFKGSLKSLNGGTLLTHKENEPVVTRLSEQFPGITEGSYIFFAIPGDESTMPKTIQELLKPDQKGDWQFPIYAWRVQVKTPIDLPPP